VKIPLAGLGGGRGWITVTTEIPWLWGFCRNREIGYGHFEERLNQVLAGYATFLRDKELALAKHQPYLVRWGREFLLFARDHGGYTFEQTLDLFLAEVGGRVGTKPWQLQHGRWGQHSY